MVLFNLGYVIAASITHPDAAFHRWITVGIIMIGETHMTMFMFYVNEEKHIRFGRILLISQYIIAIVISIFFFITTYNADKIFFIQGHYWDFNAIDASRIVAYFIEAYIVVFIIVMIWKVVSAKNRKKWILLLLGISYLIEAIIPSITNIMSRNGIIDRGTYQITWDMFNVLGFSMVTFIYINISKDRITFLGKIIGISLVSLLLVLQWFSYYSTTDQDKTYDRLKMTQTRLLIRDQKSVKYISDNHYLRKHDILSKKSTTLILGNKNIKNIHDYNNTITFLQHSENETQRRSILNKMVGFRKLIISCDKNVLQYIHSFNYDLRLQKKQLLQIKSNNFAKDSQLILKKVHGRLKPFTNDIIEYIKKTPLKEKKLKNKVASLFNPIYKPQSRFYRINNDLISISYIVLENNSIYETGFSYRVYRQFFHPNAVKFIILLGVMLFVVVVGFRFLFLGTFVRPINTLVKAMSQVKSGNLEISIPVQNRDELGFITHNFNKMVSYLFEAKHQLEDYASNLEQMVTDRTTKLESANEELGAAMEELSAINETLTHTNHELEEAQRIATIDMKMAINVQTNFFPRIAPISSEWEVAYLFYPMAGISGDLYDFYLDEEQLSGISLFDVSGHGIASGLITMLAKSILFRAYNAHTDKPLNEVMEIFNSELIEEIRDVDNYLTGIMLRFNEKEIDLVNAGHPEPIIFNATNKDVRLLTPPEHVDGGYFLGIEAMKGEYTKQSFIMEENDYLLAYTDCLVESKNKEGEQYSVEKVIKSLKNSEAPDPKRKLEKIIYDLYNFTGTKKLDDDLTIILIRRTSK